MQAGGHRFDPGTLHHKKLTEGAKEFATSLSFLKEKFRCTLKTEHCYYDAIMRRQHKGKFIYKKLGKNTILAKINFKQYEPA